jgi:hypothetical protein
VFALGLVETSGRADALVTSVAFNLAGGAPWPGPTECGYCSRTIVKAGGEVTILPTTDGYGDYVWSFSVPHDYKDGLVVVVTYFDEEGRRGSVTELVALPWVK